MATPDNGLAAQLYIQGKVTAKAGNGTPVTIESTSHYPFNDEIDMKVTTKGVNAFPIYLRVPKWCDAPILEVNGKMVAVDAKNGEYIKLDNKWKTGDKIALHLPMSIQTREWDKNKNSISVNYGPLTFSLKIDEKYVKNTNSKEVAVADAKWQPTADPTKWPTFEIYPESAWNYGLLFNKANPAQSFTVEKRAWPKDNNPFTNANAPILLKANGKQIPDWKIDQYGLCGLLPASPVKTSEPEKSLTLVPMGGARLRISAFPVVE